VGARVPAMVEFKVVISEAAKSFARTVADPQSAGFLGKRIGESVGGELLGLSGYTLKISGGSDRSGFPLRPDLPGGRQVRIYVGNGFGFHAPRDGQRKRRTFRGSAISEETVQINLIVEQKGPKPLAELLGAA
jgi:small subunit ribosomal protein S6e